MTSKLAIVTIASAMLFGVAPVFASGSPTVIVGTCPGAAPSGVGFFNVPWGAATAGSITTALSIVAAGGTVYVCPGTYAEQILISSNISLIGLFSKSGAGPVITATAGLINNATDLFDGTTPIAAQILVKKGVGNALINGFTVDGSNNGITGCSILAGVLYQNASGILSNVIVQHEVLSQAPPSCQDGLGVFIESGYKTPGISAVLVQNVNISTFQLNGITADGPGTNVVINSNVVSGTGRMATAAQTGIQVSGGAIGVVSNNQVSNMFYTPSGVAAAGIVAFASRGVGILSNTLTGVELPIVTQSDPSQYPSTNPTGSADGAAITGNTINGVASTTQNVPMYYNDGIDACSSYNTISLNTINNVIPNNGVSDGIHLDSGCPDGSEASGNFNTVLLNNVENSCSAILVDGPTTMQNLILLNTASGVLVPIATNDSCPGSNPISNPLQVRILPWKPGYHH